MQKVKRIIFLLKALVVGFFVVRAMEFLTKDAVILEHLNGLINTTFGLEIPAKDHAMLKMILRLVGVGFIILAFATVVLNAKRKWLGHTLLLGVFVFTILGFSLAKIEAALWLHYLMNTAQILLPVGLYVLVFNKATRLRLEQSNRVEAQS